MTPSVFVRECEQRGITLSLLPPLTPGGSPRVHVRAPGKLPPKVRDTITRHKPRIVEAIKHAELAELGAAIDAELLPRVAMLEKELEDEQ